MKIRIFALAKELGLDSKVLIDYANKAGVKIKNSALASISPEERDVIVQQINQTGASPASEDASPVLEPVREAMGPVGGKMRAISAKPLRRSGQQTPPPAVTTEDAVATAVEELPKTESAGPGTAVAGGDELPDVAAKTSEPAVAASADADQPQPAAGPVVAPMRRDDFIPIRGESSIREMKPRGTIFNRESGQTPRPTKKPRTTLPNVAAPPQYKQPKIKRPAAIDEAPAQKPDMKFTRGILESQSPLSAHLRKNAEEKGAKKVARPPIDLKSRMGQQGETTQRRRPKRQRLSDDRGQFRSRPHRRRKQKSSRRIEYSTSAQVEMPTTLRGLSESLGRPASVLLRILFDKGEMLTINDTITEDIALEIALELGVDLEIKRGRDIEEELIDILETEDAAESEQTRPPIVTILGHVDHGKTSLLDKIRSASVADGEAGGITQHIAAYQIEHNHQKITFVDTPGHAAFSEMRSRGANVTDIVVLVVAADDGVMPQTLECISHTKAAGAPMIVAMNKIDLPDVNTDRLLQDLAAQDILPTEWGGKIDVVRTSATTGEGLDDLLETILLTAELQELKTSYTRPAVGVCLESFRDEGRGPLAWLIVQKGTLRVGDVVLCGRAYGRIRAMYDDRNQEVSKAEPSTPVKVAGLDVVPEAGNHFYVLGETDVARQAAQSRRQAGRAHALSRSGRPRTLDDILEAARGGTVQDLALIIKADTPGSLEALRGEITKFEHPEVRVRIVHEGVGGVNESDVALASASAAIVIAFHVVAEDRASSLAADEGVDIRRFNIIYEVTDTIKRSLEGLLKPERVEVATGRALVLQTFHISRYGTIAGCRVLTGTIERSNRMHVIRDQTVLNSYNIASLKRNKDDVKEVREGMECGIRLDGFNDVKEGDLLEAYREEMKKRTLEST